MHTNLLAGEKSPYLLQHAHNPVNWHPWGEEAFRKARAEDKPIFLSVGYSTCHWCHVMERESFENEETAELLNRYFVPIKVDREERPDVDRIYMNFVQATTGSGGWPMSVWLTPDLKPFFGGTYFPPSSQYGRPGFPYVLERIAEAWRTDRGHIVESSRNVIEQLRNAADAPPAAGVLDGGLLDSAYYAFRRSFDTQHAGFGSAPKFPRPSVYNFLLRYYHRRGNLEALDMVFATLNAMGHGGIRDHLGGGFHRYAVDERWFVPHFEKMLYDQAQIAISYLEGYQISGDEYYATAAREILDYLLRDMRHPEGGFYSAEDADSAADPDHPEDKHEGAFYLWTQDEIERTLGDPAAGWFCYHYGVSPSGNVHQDPQGEFAGRNILYDAHTMEETAGRFGTPTVQMSEALSAARRALLEERSKRLRPHLDDKILTAWNGLAISAFAKGAQVLGEERYLEAARRAADFLRARAYTPSPGAALTRRYRDGESAIPGFLDDYAFFAQGLLDLYEAAFDVRDLELAIRLTELLRELFEDRERGGFYSTGSAGGDLLLRMKDDYDGAEPSGNSIATLALLRLSRMTGRSDFRESAEKALRAFAATLGNAPQAAPQMLAALAYSLSTPREIVLAGERQHDKVRVFRNALGRQFLPFDTVLLVDDRSRNVLARYLPAVADMLPVGGSPAAYVCENFACRLPTTEVEQLVGTLAQRRASG